MGPSAILVTSSPSGRGPSRQSTEQAAGTHSRGLHGIQVQRIAEGKVDLALRRGLRDFLCGRGADQQGHIREGYRGAVLLLRDAAVVPEHGHVLEDHLANGLGLAGDGVERDHHVDAATRLDPAAHRGDVVHRDGHRAHAVGDHHLEPHPRFVARELLREDGLVHRERLEHAEPDDLRGRRGEAHRGGAAGPLHDLHVRRGQGGAHVHVARSDHDRDRLADGGHGGRCGGRTDEREGQESRKAPRDQSQEKQQACAISHVPIPSS